MQEMNRLKKELNKRGITFKPNDEDIMRGAEYDNETTLISYDTNFILCLHTSAVVPSVWMIYDTKTLELIAIQETEKELPFVGFNVWGVCLYKKETDEIIYC